MILGIGNDLVRESRIARVHARHGERFSHKLLMPEERATLAGAARAANRLAKAWAAKEAFAKAWGTGFRGLSHLDCGVLRDASGQPCMIFSAAQAERLQARGVQRVHLALTDQDDWVLATVVIEGGIGGGSGAA